VYQVDWIRVVYSTVVTNNTPLWLISEHSSSMFMTSLCPLPSDNDNKGTEPIFGWQGSGINISRGESDRVLNAVK